MFNPFACSYFRTPLSKCYHLHEHEKRRAYDERVREVERACFSPLVFAATGGMGPTATTVFKKLASLLSEKRSINYRRCLYWLRCRLCYSLLRWSVMCLRGHCSTHRGPKHQTLKWPTLRVTLSPAAAFECWSPSCPALCHLVLGVVARAVHLAREKKKSFSIKEMFFFY